MEKTYQYVADRRFPAGSGDGNEDFPGAYAPYEEDTEEQREQRYDVLRFTEYGDGCSQSVDNVRGELLIYYLSGSPTVDKKTLFLWCRQLGNTLDAYHRCRRGQYCRYLNPYSIVVSESRLMLLDLESEENAPVIKMMQQRAVRRHFIDQAVQAGAGGAREAELYGYGKTIQFLLACAQIAPELTPREERHLANVIAACTGGSKKRYQEIRQAVKDLPVLSPGYEALRENRTLRTAILGCGAAALVSLLAVGAVTFGRGNAAARHTGTGESGREEGAVSGQSETDIRDVSESDKSGSEYEARDNAEDARSREREEDYGSTEAADGTDVTGAADAADALDAEPSSEEGEAAEERPADGDTILLQASELVGKYLDEDTSAANARAIVMAHKMELTAVRTLAEAYMREGMAEEAAEAWGRLIEIEEDVGAAEEAAIRKMNLEAELGRLDQAVRTGEDALEEIGESVLIEALVGEYKGRLEEGQADAGEPE